MREQLVHFPPGDEILGVELAGKSWCDGSYRIERPCSQVWVVEQVLEGEGTILVDGRRFTARAGDLYLLPAGRQHCYWADPQNPWVKVFVNLEGQLPGELFSVYGLAHQVVFPQSGAEELLCGLYDRLCQEGPGAVMREMPLLLHRICLHLYRQRLPALPEEARQLRDYLDRNLHRLVPVAELAASIYRSPDYTNRLFRRCYGITPYAYLLQRKMALACTLLESTALPVSEIAARLGYEDAQYFSGLFRRMQGVTPTGWRRGERRTEEK